MSRNTYSRRQILSLLPAVVLAGCGDDHGPRAPGFPRVKWRIVSTTQFTADIVRVVGGEAVNSICFVPPGINPHAFRPDGPEIARVHTSDMVITHGLGWENRWSQDFDELANSNVKLASVTAGIPPERILKSAEPGGPPDPHVWNAPDLAVYMVDAVARTLIEAMPQLADYFAPRAHRLKVEFDDLHKLTSQRMQGLKDKDRFLLTSHDSMQYFARAFQLEARAIAAADGAVPESVPDPLKEWIQSHSVKSLFREPFTDAIALRKLLADLRVNPDNLIYSLTLPAAGTTAMVSFKSYEVSQAAGAEAHNADNVQFTLQVD